MLNSAEIHKLFDLLHALHGKDKPRDGRTVAIWTALLEPWDYPQVRSAALARARENRYYPDPAELTAYLPKRSRGTPAGGTAPQSTGESDERARRAQEELFAAWQSEGEELRPKREEAGLEGSLNGSGEGEAPSPWAWYRQVLTVGLEGWKFCLREGARV